MYEIFIKAFDNWNVITVTYNGEQIYASGGSNLTSEQAAAKVAIDDHTASLEG